jgi:hypothetical protein
MALPQEVTSHTYGKGQNNDNQSEKDAANIWIHDNG